MRMSLQIKYLIWPVKYVRISVGIMIENGTIALGIVQLKNGKRK